jgi:hypothetical protein
MWGPAVYQSDVRIFSESAMTASSQSMTACLKISSALLKLHRFPQKIEAQTEQSPISLKIFRIVFRNMSDLFLHNLRFLLHSGQLSLNRCWLKLKITRVCWEYWRTEFPEL